MIIGRGLQGLSAAFMSPAALSIVLTNFSEGKARNTALGIWAAVAAGGAAAGLLLGGVLTQYLSWRWNFFVNLPVGAFIVFMALRMVPAHAKEEKENSLDLPGAILVTSGLITLVYTLVKAPEWGWTHGSTVGLLAVSVALLASFVWNEAKVRHPLVPLSIFRIRNVSAANLVQLPITASLFAMFFFLSLYVQNILGYSPVVTGVSFLPVTVLIAVTATLTSRFIAKVGFKPILVVAPLIMGFGFLLLSRIPVDGQYLTDVLPGLAFLAIGAGMSFVALTITATSGVPGDESGLASGLINTAQQIGGALGLAILSGIATSHMTTALMDGSNPAAAAVAGYHSAFQVGVGFAVAASILAAILIHNKKQTAADPHVAAH
jgi:EmrB/QacA subfamily drug resistance transporter